MPLSRSEYLEKSDIFAEASEISRLSYDHIYFLEEPTGAGSDASDSDIQATRLLNSSIFAEKVRKLWIKFRESLSLDVSDNSERERRALEFKKSLRAINEYYGSESFYSDNRAPYLAFQSREFDALDTALEEAMASSLMVEDDDENSEPQEDPVKISWATRMDEYGVETRFLILEDLEFEIERDYF
ncbi:hypothetical protein TWF694_003144 [Orbilia ellipsospora]|uniref:Uncharacterized protein n=1 Tax=Orbilia ellipsospora TaxID=2528407 RepID=A0AAV9X0V7_9PEZI